MTTRRSGGMHYTSIEISDFAVTVAKTALWIAESHMMKETEDVVHIFLPLKSYANITEGNALRLDWESVVPKHRLNYIMGNPPFAGARMMSSEQKDDVNATFPGWKNAVNPFVMCRKSVLAISRLTVVTTSLPKRKWKYS